MRRISPSSASSITAASPIRNGPTFASPIITTRLLIADPLDPSEVVQAGVDGLQQDPEITVTADHPVRHERGDELGIGRQRLHQGVDIRRR